MIDADNAAVILAFGFLAATIAYLLARLKCARRLARIEAAKNAEILALRVNHDERLELERKEHEEAIEQLRADYRRDLEGTVARHEEKLKEKVESDLSVTIHPFVNTESRRTLFMKETEVKIGYKYQLFVRGLPCFEPHSVVVESSVIKEVDGKRLEMFKDKALELAKSVADLKVGGLITIAKTVVKVLK